MKQIVHDAAIRSLLQPLPRGIAHNDQPTPFFELIKRPKPRYVVDGFAEVIFRRASIQGTVWFKTTHRINNGAGLIGTLARYIQDDLQNRYVNAPQCNWYIPQGVPFEPYVSIESIVADVRNLTAMHENICRAAFCWGLALVSLFDFLAKQSSDASDSPA